MTNLEYFQSLNAKEFAAVFGEVVCRRVPLRNACFDFTGKSCKGCIVNFLNAERDPGKINT